MITMLSNTLKKFSNFINPWKTIKELKTENDRLLNIIENPFMSGIEIGNGTIDIGLKGGAASILAGMFAGLLEAHEDIAPNYLQVSFNSPKGPIVVIVQQPNGKSPHQLKIEAEQKVKLLEDVVKFLAFYRKEKAEVVIDPSGGSTVSILETILGSEGGKKS
jgi:hypothetical protein